MADFTSTSGRVSLGSFASALSVVSQGVDVTPTIVQINAQYTVGLGIAGGSVLSVAADTPTYQQVFTNFNSGPSLALKLSYTSSSDGGGGGGGFTLPTTGQIWPSGLVRS